MIKCCIFDLDGTLLDTITTITYYVNLVLLREGIEEISEDECKYFVGDGARKLIQRALESRNAFDEQTFSRVFLEYNRAYNADTAYLTEPYPNIPELLSELKKRKIKLGVLSNKPDEAVQDIIARYFPGVFDAVHGAREGVRLKPAPDGVIEMYKELGVLADEVMYVGDTGVDMQTGRAAGAHVTVGVTWGFRTKDELISSGADTLADSALDILGEVEN